ncbi:MAG: hypothetical protein ACKPFA_29595, partial [Dolichospermum sp.]
ASSQLRVNQPTSGTINLINERSQPSSGYLSLTVVDSRALDQVEDQKTVPYTIPARHQETLSFQQGPSGQFKGDKKFTAWTARDNRSSSLTVYA